jgi:tRNA(fMet)-specific endonuclease VapC
MENLVCVDTDIIIDHLRGRLPGAELFAGVVVNQIPYTTYINRFELLCGANTTREREIIEECLMGFKVLPFDELSSNEAARIYRDLKQKGQLVGIRDILIAGIALAHKLHVATKNLKDFRRIKGLSLWTK